MEKIKCPKCGRDHEADRRPTWGEWYFRNYCPPCWQAFGEHELAIYEARSPMRLPIKGLR